jgi:hypothetical protein
MALDPQRITVALSYQLAEPSSVLKNMQSSLTLGLTGTKKLVVLNWVPSTFPSYSVNPKIIFE